MLIKSVGDIRHAQQRALDHQATVLAVGKLDLASGIDMAQDEAWKLAQRYRLLGEDPWAPSGGVGRFEPPPPNVKRTL
jgi:hypothetical protein